jgi:hypothetical protein
LGPGRMLPGDYRGEGGLGANARIGTSTTRLE